MMTATVSWALPTVDENGEIMDPRDIAGVKVELRIVGASFGVVEPLSTGLELVVPDLEVGDWEFRLTAVNTAGVESPAPVAEAFRVPNAAAPGPVTDTAVVLS